MVEKILDLEKRVSELKALNFVLSDKLVKCLNELKTYKKIHQDPNLLKAHLALLEAMQEANNKSTDKGT